jgi:hypothetical protein
VFSNVRWCCFYVHRRGRSLNESEIWKLNINYFKSCFVEQFIYSNIFIFNILFHKIYYTYGPNKQTTATLCIQYVCIIHIQNIKHTVTVRMYRICVITDYMFLSMSLSIHRNWTILYVISAVCIMYVHYAQYRNRLILDQKWIWIHNEL